MHSCPQLGAAPQRMPGHLKQEFEAKGWMVYNEWLAKYDAFFQMQSDGTSSSSSGSSSSPGSAEKLELLLLDIDLSTGYDCDGGDGHGVVVFRLGNQWRVAQSFAFKISLVSYLSTTHWMGAEEVSEWWCHCKKVSFAGTSEMMEAEASTTPFLGFRLQTDAAGFRKRNGFSVGRSLSAVLVKVDFEAYLSRCQEFLQAWTAEMRP
jgi:hypothetical protein